ncbi:hypothetical protein [Thalassotalea atypica]|uniref:hypothetical protein n=1 Tax=Thalassotalea atypica TaxID=2054316 RepID=UPI0025730450|nr:hypothetical protein [Thalassotalea atypica]
MAALFAVFSGLYIAINAPQIWLSRWSPATLSITHSLALGVMAMVMFGSLFQLLPVLCGAPIALGCRGLVIFQSLFVAGICALLGSFNGMMSPLIALNLLGASLCLFIFILLKTLVFNAGGVQTKRPMMLAVICLVITIILGLVMLANFSWAFASLSKAWTNLHAAFGFYGWILLLVMTVSFQVIPMFHVTPEFSKPSRLIPWLVTLQLFALLFSVNEMAITRPLLAILNCIVIGYALVALKQLRQRKRKLPDNTIYFWQFALGSLILGCLLVLMLPWIPNTLVMIWPMLIGVVFGFGFVLSVIQGLLLKIIPFLITLHLQQHAMNHPMGMGLMPDHYSLIPRAFGTRLFKLHVVTVIFMVLGFWLVQFSQLAGALMASGWTYLLVHIVLASKKYRQIHQAIART